MLRVVDLFAGCGGMSLGFERAGFEIVAAYEYWNVAADSYASNFNHPVYMDDLSNISSAVAQIKSIMPDVIIGGPPCQDFSHAGKRVEGERATLTEAFAEIVSQVKPMWFVMENVDRTRRSDAYKTAREVLLHAGYGLTEVVLNAALCGVPQRRKRFFCLGSLKCKSGFLDEYITHSQSDAEMTLRQYFKNSLDFEHYYRHPRNYSRRAIYSIDEPSATIRGVSRPVPQGYPGHHLDTSELNESIRPLSTAERMQVQTFPPSFVLLGNKTDAEQMIGNAVPVELATFVGRALLHHIHTTA